MLAKGLSLLVLGFAIAVVLILARIIWGSPLVSRVRESFANQRAVKPVNTMTECPPGSTMYMYDGVAYCCGGQISIDADSAAGTCRPATSAPGAAPPLFCTLGAATDDGVPNCVETRAGMIQVYGERLCPTEMPNYVIPPVGEKKCCAGVPNADSTNCANPEEKYCKFAGEGRWLTDPNSCEWIKFHEDHKSCPTGMTEVMAAGHGPIEGTSVFGCLNQSEGKFCYSKALTDKLSEMGYDSSSLTVCSPNSG